MPRKPAKEREVVCVVCGALFLTRHSQGKYCSDNCQQEGKRESWRKYGQNNKDKRKENSHNHYIENKEQILERTKKYRETEKGKAIRRFIDKRQREIHPEKYQARQEVLKAVRKGELTKQPCESCGETKVEAHHNDYSNPLEVTWLCKTCHNKETWKEHGL